MNKIAAFLITVTVILCVFTAAAADQNGTDIWCNIDEYGCWVTDKEINTNKIYIQFWTEEARDYVMGNITEEGNLVSSKPADAEKKLNLDQFDCDIDEQGNYFCYPVNN